jgi:hypothetical protein
MHVATEILVADECWIALALLHCENPDRVSFKATEIMEKLRKEKLQSDLRSGLQPHIHLHNVANLPPNSARYRMFYRLEDGTLRLFVPGDQVHPERKGKACPRREEIPERFHYLLDWYEKEYCEQTTGEPESSNDFVLTMRGVGKEIWADVGGDVFVDAHRSSWKPEAESSEELEERVWKRILSHQGEEFQTKTGIPFTYSVDGENGIWFNGRDGKRINMRLWRGDIKKAIKKYREGPLKKVTDLKDMRDPSYLYGLLTDERIHGTDW